MVFARFGRSIGLESVEHVEDMADERLFVCVGARDGVSTLCNRAVLVAQNAKIGLQYTCALLRSGNEGAGLGRVGNKSKYWQR
ncbi:MAG: hypothetical protein WBF86_12340 [Mycobacterium sp.]